MLIILIPVLPEYIAPILAVGSLIAAAVDAKGQGRSITIGLLGKLIVLYIVCMAIGLVYAWFPLATLATVFMWIFMFMVYLALTTVLTNRRRLNVLLIGICIAAGVIGLIGCVEYIANAIFGWPLSLQFWLFLDATVYSWLPLRLLPFSSDLRACSTFSNPNLMAEYLTMVFPFIIFYCFSGKRTSTRILCRLCLALAAGGIAFTFSRGSYLALFVIAAVFFITNIRRAFLFLVAIAGGMVVLPNSVVERIFSVKLTDGSIAERLSIWMAGLEEIGKHWLLGIGAGAENSWQMLLSHGINAPHMHNLALQLLVEGGIIALAIILYMGWKLLYKGIGMVRRSHELRFSGITIMAFAFGFAVEGLVEFPFLTPKLIGVFLMAVAIVESMSNTVLGCTPEPLKAAALSALQPLHSLKHPHDEPKPPTEN